MEWYEQPYPGAPALKVPFVRNLYPPDAKADGKTPSSPLDDVKAVKRCVSRLGRWPWPTDEDGAPFDGTFSNAFSHGKDGGNVGDSGVQGVQRQQNSGKEPYFEGPIRGWYGKDMHQLLCNAVIPEGLPHAGDYAMDANARTLFAIAYAKVHEQKPVAASKRKEALELARSQLGVKESPYGSNRCKYTTWYGITGPWCAMFLTWCFENGPVGGSPSFVRGSKYAYVPYVVHDARNRRNGLATTSSPIPGDLVCYDWGRDGTYDHIGIFERGNASSWTAIEGNTSLGNNSNGGQVMRRYRSRGDAAVVFVRVAQ